MEMIPGRPTAVYPMGVVGPPPQVAAVPPATWMRIPQGWPGTLGGLGLRLAQAFFAAASVAAMASTVDVFPIFSIFRYLIAAASLQCLWSLAVAVVYIYALLVRRSLLNFRAVFLCFIGDWITGSITFSAASASAGISILIANDARQCAHIPCYRFITAITMAFFSWIALVPSFMLNCWFVVSALARAE